MLRRCVAADPPWKLAPNRLQRFELELQGHDVLSDLIVQVTRDPSPFILLNGYDARQQLSNPFLGGRPLLQLRLQKAVGGQQFSGALAHPLLECRVRLAQRVLGPRPIGEVPYDADEAADIALRIVNGHRASAGNKPAAILAQMPPSGRCTAAVAGFA